MRRFIATGVIIFLLLVGLIVLFAGRGAKPVQQQGVARPSTLVSYADTSTEVRYTMEGQINARENHRVVQITVGQNYRTYTLFDGYQGSIIKTENLGNDQDAYRAFLAALQNSGFTKTGVASRNTNPLGACPTGQRSHYDIIQGSDTLQSLWSTSCGSVHGTFAGSAGTVQKLFQAQIPNYTTLVQGVQF